MGIKSWYNKTILPKLLEAAMFNKEMEVIRRDVLKEVRGDVLEIGVGAGYNLLIYQNVSKVYALEPSDELIKIAKDKATSLAFPVEFIKSGAENIPLPDNSVDMVVSTWVMCSVENPERVINEIFRVLKSGGRFTFVEHGKSPNNFASTIQSILTPFTKQIAGGCHLNRDIKELLRHTNFEIIKLENFSLKWKPLAYMYKGVAVSRK